MRKLAAGTIPHSLGEIITADANGMDIEVEALIVHSASTALSWFEVWFMGCRMVKANIQPGQTINILKYLGLESFTIPPGDGIEAVSPPGSQVNFMAFGSRFQD
jgi:hypothetical protein